MMILSRVYIARKILVRPLLSINQRLSSASSLPNTTEKDVIYEQIQDLFHKKWITNADVKAHLDNYIDNMSLGHISVFVFRASRRKYTLQPAHFHRLTDALTKTTEPISGLPLGQLIYGLRTQSSSCAEVRRFLRVVESRINKHEGMKLRFVSLALSGLKNMTLANNIELQNLISFFTQKIQEAEESFYIVDWYHSLYSMQNMRSEQPEAIALISAIVTKPVSDIQRLGSRGIAMCMFGLQGMSSHEPAVRSAIAVVTNMLLQYEHHHYVSPNSVHNQAHVEYDRSYNELCAADGDYDFSHNDDEQHRSSETVAKDQGGGTHGGHGSGVCMGMAGAIGTMDAIAISNVFYGMQRCHSSHTEVRNLLNVASRYSKRVPGPYSGMSIGSYLYGFQCMSSEDREVRQALRIVCTHIESVKTPILFRSAASAMYGLRNMNASYPEVAEVVEALASKLSLCDDISAEGFIMLSYGLRTMSSSQYEVRYMVLELLKIIQSEREASRIVIPIEGCCRMLLCLRNMSSDHAEVSNILSELAHHLRLGLQSSLQVNSAHSGSKYLNDTVNFEVSNGAYPGGRVSVASTRSATTNGVAPNNVGDIDYDTAAAANQETEDIIYTSLRENSNSDMPGGAMLTGSDTDSYPAGQNRRRGGRLGPPFQLSQYITGKGIANGLYGLQSCNIVKHRAVREVVYALIECSIHHRPVFSSLDVRSVLKVLNLFLSQLRQEQVAVASNGGRGVGVAGRDSDHYSSSNEARGSCGSEYAEGVKFPVKGTAVGDDSDERSSCADMDDLDALREQLLAFSTKLTIASMNANHKGAKRPATTSRKSHQEPRLRGMK